MFGHFWHFFEHIGWFVCIYVISWTSNWKSQNKYGVQRGIHDKTMKKQEIQETHIFLYMFLIFVIFRVFSLWVLLSYKQQQSVLQLRHNVAFRPWARGSSVSRVWLRVHVRPFLAGWCMRPFLHRPKRRHTFWKNSEPDYGPFLFFCFLHVLEICRDMFSHFWHFFDTCFKTFFVTFWFLFWDPIKLSEFIKKSSKSDQKTENTRTSLFFGRKSLFFLCLEQSAFIFLTSMC